MNIPIFVPHVGCPNDCAFCNQRSITGVSDIPTAESVHATVKSYLSGGRRGNHTIAFFGGSFTGIEPKLQRVYLAAAREYLKSGQVSGIRLSTRPDYIDDERLDLLEEFGVTNIELGAQSMDNHVLAASGRGHDAKAVENASRLIKSRGFTLGLQMMTGLPLDTPEKSVATAQRFIELGAEETRIYPTLVMENTALEHMYRTGRYSPQTIEEAADLSARLYAMFRKAKVKVLRIGLSDSTELKGGCVAGPYHPAMGELTVSRYIRNQLEGMAENNRLDVLSPQKFISKIVGNKKCNRLFFETRGIELSVHCGSDIPVVNGKYILDV